MGAEQRDIAAGSSTAKAFTRQGYVVLPALIEPALAEFLWSYVHTKFASMLLSSGDRLVPHAPSRYGDPPFDGLLEYLRPRIEAACGLGLLSTYSYVRLYKHGDSLKRHHDRPACEISISLNLGQTPSEPWPLYIEAEAGPFGARLSPGDALLYRGIDFEHWREPFAGDRLAQVFLFYVDKDGPHAGQKFDGRATLMRPKKGDANEGNQATD